MQLWQYRLLVTAMLLYMFRTLSASIIRSINNCSSSHWCMPLVGVGCHNTSAVATDLGHPYWIYITPTNGMHQWLLLQFLVLLMMDAKSVLNMQSNIAVTNKQYCQSCIFLVLYIIQSYDERKLKHKKKNIYMDMFFVGSVREKIPGVTMLIISCIAWHLNP